MVVAAVVEGEEAVEVSVLFRESLLTQECADDSQQEAAAEVDVEVVEEAEHDELVLPDQKLYAEESGDVTYTAAQTSVCSCTR